MQIRRSIMQIRRSIMQIRRAGPTLETLDFTFHIDNTPTFFYFDLNSIGLTLGWKCTGLHDEESVRCFIRVEMFDSFSAQSQASLVS